MPWFRPEIYRIEIELLYAPQFTINISKNIIFHYTSATLLFVIETDTIVYIAHIRTWLSLVYTLEITSIIIIEFKVNNNRFV